MTDATYDELVAEGVSLAKTMLGSLYEALKNMAPPPSSSEEELAARRWQVFLSTMLLEVASAAADAAASGYPRGIAILNRSVYEYNEKLKFFSRDKATARIQFATVPIRNYALMEKVAPTKDLAQHMTESYDAWRAANGSLDEYTGNKSLLNMHLATTKPESILVDERNPKLRYTREHKTLHDVPSQVVHGEGVLMFDVFDDLDDPKNFNARLRSRVFTVVRELSKLVTLLCDFLLSVYRNGTDVPALADLSQRMVEFRARADAFNGPTV
jgi:hypothetical protein